jgi:hypothetical protein
MDSMQWTLPPNILCLGLGSPSESRSARFQLALMLEIIDHCNIVGYFQSLVSFMTY